MKKVLTIALALFLLLSTCALAVPAIDTAQLTTPFNISPDEFIDSTAFWVDAIVTTGTRSAWSAATDIGGGYAMQYYTVDNLVEVFMIHKGGQVYAIGVCLPDGATMDDFTACSTAFGTDLAMILYAAATPGINDDNLFEYEDTIMPMTDASFTSKLQEALTSAIPTSGMVGGSTTLLAGNMLTTHLDLSLAGNGVAFTVIYAPAAYNF